MTEKKSSYLLEFPNEDFKKCLKLASAIECKSMKDFILDTLRHRISEILDSNNIISLDSLLNKQYTQVNCTNRK